MKVGLIDAELMLGDHINGKRYGKEKSHIFPNIVCMKLAAWHKSQGDEVEWCNMLDHYDRVYISKVFSRTPDFKQYIDADEIIKGGSGYSISTRNGVETWQDNKKIMQYLPNEIEHIMPDYSMYPMVQDTAFGFLTRGCPRGCGFCHVAAKEGRKSYKVADLTEWWSGQKNIILLDPNILACKNCSDLLKQLIESKAYVDFSQGLDARFMTAEKAKLLTNIKTKRLHFAWDDYKQKDSVLKGLKLFADNYGKSINHNVETFVLINYDTTFQQDLERVYTLKDLGLEPYVMIYDKEHCSTEKKRLQRWVNMRSIFHKVPTFEQYNINV